MTTTQIADQIQREAVDAHRKYEQEKRVRINQGTFITGYLLARMVHLAAIERSTFQLS